jgi:hypothetical protein
MAFIEFPAEERTDLVPAVDSTMALSTTVKKGDVPKVTARATTASPASFDPKWVLKLSLLVVVDVVDTNSDSAVAIVTLLEPSLVRIVVASEEMDVGRITDIRLGISEEAVDENNLLWRSSLHNLGIIVSVRLIGLGLILSHSSAAFLVVSEDMMLFIVCCILCYLITNLVSKFYYDQQMLLLLPTKSKIQLVEKE